MPVSHSPFGAFQMTFLALTLAPASASAASSHASAAHDAAKACTKAPVEIVAGSTTAKVALARCDGAAVPASVVQLSALARPAAATKAHKIDPRVVERLEVVADHFRKDGQVPRIVLVPGNKPRTSGSLHASGRALDFKIEGVPNEDVVAFCKTMTDTGCGFYPTAGFVHVDVREHGIGHVSWIDVSKPGEAPRYVSSWPPPGEASPAREHEKAELHAAAGKKGADVNVVAAADEPKLPPLPAAAQFAPLESPKVAAPAETPKVAAAPEVVVTTTTAAATAKDPAPKEPEAKDAARKTASKKEGRKGKRRHHRHAAEATDATHPTVQNPS
jgi:uncharacterized protein YcbK (DUF882 family)